ncbi:hypothetical protein FRB90_008949 [Tulasnella sp. 427]|nr:hypothetical protein FRB90_008949 [Tulasnella sp. 427]
MDRAQLLQGLRTGGPRSASFGNAPLTANPAQTRFASNVYQQGFIDEPNHLVDRFGNISLNGAGGAPMTAGLDMVALHQQQQQQIALLQAQAQVAAMIAQQGGGPQAEAQAVQMQIELMRIQALQQQQNFQTQLLLQQQQMQQQQQQQQLRQAPSTAGPFQSSFPDAAAAQTRTAAAAQLRARAAGREATMRASVSEEQLAPPPMTAGVNGKFGVGVAAPNRAVSSPLNPNAAAFVGRFGPDLSAAVAAASSRASISEAGTPGTPTYGATTVISGGTALGSPGGNLTPSNSYNGLSGYNNSGVTVGPTKADTASSWRRGSTSSTPVQTTTPPNGFNKAPSPPSRQRSTSPPGSGTSTPSKVSVSNSTISLNSEVSGRNSIVSPLKVRPSPLRFTSPPLVDAFGNVMPMALRAGSPSNSNDGISLNDDAVSSIKSSPTSSTPPSSAGSAVGVPTSGMTKEREEAAKKLYEGLGLGRPAPFPANVVVPSTAVPNQKVEPIRQPLGPPCSVDELGPMNFASRMRKKALGGLMDARERREAAAALNVEFVGA